MLNHYLSFFDIQVWYLADKVACRSILDNDYGALWRHFDEGGEAYYKSLINLNTKCIYFEDLIFDEEKIEEYTRTQANIIQAVFNLFSELHPIVITYAAIVEPADTFFEDQKSTVISIVELEPIAKLELFRSRPFKIKESATLERINQLYKVVCEVCEKYPQVIVTLSKYNSSMTKGTHNDRLIDITICLESLIRERNELSFKFASYISYITKETPQDRLEAFSILTLLYNARSGLIHGAPESKDIKKALEEVAEKWSEIINIAKGALIYYLFYLYLEFKGAAKEEWKAHLRRLLLGVDNRIT